MPKKEINYDNTYFYRIVCKNLNILDCYIGHTTNFIKRKAKHKNACNNENHTHYNYRIYNFIRDNGGWDNWDMVMIEQIKCDNLLEACKIERNYLEEYKANLNVNLPMRTHEELKEYQKEYRNNNNEKMKEYKQQYYENNKDKIKENYKKMIYCDCCKKEIAKHNISTHFKTQTHINNTQKQDINI